MRRWVPAMSRRSTRRAQLWEESKCSTGLGVGTGKVAPRSTSRMDSIQHSVDKVRSLKREGFSHLKLLVSSRSGKQREVAAESLCSTSTPSPDVDSTEDSPEGDELHPNFRKKLGDILDQRKWTVIQTRGKKPAPRFNHATAVVGRKLLVIGGETGSGTRNDVQMLHLGKLSWTKIGVGDSAPSNGLPIKTGPVQELPHCRGHSLITWGKTVILIGGQMDPPSDRVAVWSFDLEMDSWTKVVTKGEIPTARSGHSVTRAGSILIMLGGEDSKGRKLNDLHILDLKSLMWLPLHPTGRGPSPRARHIADMFDDRFLLIFGGETKSKISNDIYALDFDNMEWCKLKTIGHPSSPRAGHAGALVGSRWYIAGGESRLSGILDTMVLDMSTMEWSVVAPARIDSVAAVQGLSLSFVERKEKRFLVAFGGCGQQASNVVQVLHIPSEEQASRKTLAGLLQLPTTPDAQLPSRNTQVVRSHQGQFQSLMGSTIPCACVSVAKPGVDSDMDNRSSSQRSSSRSTSEFSVDFDRDSGLIPLRTRYAMAQNSIAQSGRLEPRVEPLSRRYTAQISRTDSMTRRSGGQGSSWDSFTSSRRRDLPLPKLRDFPAPAVAGSEVSVRQDQSAQRIRGDLQSTESTTPSVESGLISAKDLQITAPSVHPGLVSAVDDAGTLLLQNDANFSSRARPCKGGSQSSEFSGYAETFVSGTGEEHNSEPSITDSISWVDSGLNMSTSSTGCPSPMSSPSRPIPDFEEDELQIFSNSTTTDYTDAEPTGFFKETNSDVEVDEGFVMSTSTTSGIEEDEVVIVSKLRKAGTADEQNKEISKLREHHERKLDAAIRTGELLAGQFAEALRNRDEAERILHTVNESRQHAEGKLAMALKQIQDLQDRLSATEQAQEESNHFIHSARVEKLTLEQDLAMKEAVLCDSQKELQATRGVLIAEGTRAFQLQVELFDVQHKLQTLNSQGVLPPCLQQSILA